MKILVDASLSPAWCGALAAHGIDSVHWATIGDLRAPDAQILEWARKNDCVVSLTTSTSVRSWRARG